MTSKAAILKVENTLDSISFAGSNLKIRCNLEGPDNWLQIFTPGANYGRKWRLSAWMTPGEVAQTALLAAIQFAEHEVRESFRFRGRQIFTPHHTLNSLLQIADEKEMRNEPTDADR